MKRLKSGDPAQVEERARRRAHVREGGAAAVPAIADLLKQGLPPALTQAAIETLGDTENEAASEALGWYARHRNPGSGAPPSQALGEDARARGDRALRAALSDPDPGVRGLSATGLGSMKAKDAVADLFVALDHKVDEAAASIGQLCAGAECDQLAASSGACRSTS